MYQDLVKRWPSRDFRVYIWKPPAGPYCWNVSACVLLVRPLISLIRNRPNDIHTHWESYRFEVLHFWKCLLLSFRYTDLRHPIFFILFCSYELLCYRYHEMQLRILTRQGGVNACALARWTHSAFRPAIFCFLLEIPIHFIFRLHPKYTKSQRSKPPPRFPGAGILLFAKGAPFAQFTKMSAKDGWAMLLWTHSVFRACGVSCASFLLSATRCLIEYVHVYTLHKLPGVQPMVTVQCSFAFWPGRVV